MRVILTYIGWAIFFMVLGFVLAQYTSLGMLLSFGQKLPGCF